MRGYIALIAALAVVVQGQFMVGYGQSDLSPSEEQMRRGEVFLGGYGFWKFRGRPQGVHDPIWARSIVISANNTVLATCVIDSTGISNRMLKEIRSGVNAQTGIPTDNVMISATHTHSGPDYQGLWGFVSDEYRQQVIDLTIESLVSAYRAQVPARIYSSFAVGEANNRRDWGYTDTDVVTLDVIGLDGERVCTLINFAAHPVVLGSSNMLFSGDYCHYVREVMEKYVGAPVAYFSGAIGDVSPNRGGYSDFEAAEWYGTEIANWAFESLDSKVEIAPSLIVKTANFTSPVTNPLFLLAFRIGMLDYDTNPDDSIDTRASYFRLGTTLQGVSFPGESLTRNGLAIKDAMKTEHKLFLGLNSDTLGYFVPSDEWRTGRHDNYEENVSIYKFVGDNTRDILVELIENDQF